MSINFNLGSTQTIVPDAPGVARRPFLTPLPEPSHFLLVIDNTGLDKIKRCHRAAATYLILGREAHAKNAALAFGGAVHQGLEALLLGKSVDEQNQAILRYFTENPAPPDEYRTPTVALEVLKHYRHRSNELIFPDYEWDLLRDSSGLLVERSFELPLGVLEVEALIPIELLPGIDATKQRVHVNPDGTTFLFVHSIHLAWSGRIDAIAACNSRVRVVDHKTTSITGDQFIQAFQIASQTIGYVWAAQQLWPDLHPTGFCLNALALKKPTKGSGLMDRGPRGGEPALSFFRSYFDYSPERIAEWSEDTMCHIEDFIHSLVRGRFPLNDKQCFDKYGQCPYHSVCTIDDPVIRSRLLASDAFRQVTWNPVSA